MTDACCLGFDFQIEHYRIFRTGYHCLHTGIAPNEQISVNAGNILFGCDGNRIFNHLLGGKSVAVAASRYGNTAVVRKLDIG